MMTPESNSSLRVRIAEAQGFKWCRVGTEEKPYRMLCIWNPVYTPADMTETVCNPEYMWEHGRVPDYPNSLDACAQFEAGLTDAQREVYIEHLRGITARAHPKMDQLRRKVSAAAHQRCLAYLATINPQERK